MTTPLAADRKLAVLIDADNVQADVIAPLLAETERLGVVCVKRIYGDWMGERLAKWKAALLPFSLSPVQQFAYTPGKNATDIAMVIDAMDLLHSDVFDGFCIVSSDSDFAPLALRIRQSGILVFGFGEEKAPDAFRRACHRFILLENLSSVEKGKLPGKHSQKSDDLRLRSGEGGRANDGKAGTVSRDLFSALQGETQRQLKDLVYQAIRKAAGDDGWAELGHVGNLIKKAQGDFEARHYGFARLLDLVVSVPAVVSKTGDAPSEIFVRRLSWRHFIMLVQEIINSYANARGEASLAAVCCAFGQRHPDFDVRSLGHRKLPDAVRAIHGAWVEVHCLEGIEMLRMGQRMT